MKSNALLFLVSSVCFLQNGVVPSDFPVPPQSKKTLFYIHRSPNPTTVVYEVNLSANNVINSKNPVKVFWIRYGEQGQYSELNYLERTFAYGVKASPINSFKYKVQFVSSKEKSWIVSIDENGQAWASMSIGGYPSKLTKIFVQVAEDGWWPKVAYVEFFGIDIKTQKATYEKMLIT